MLKFFRKERWEEMQTEQNKVEQIITNQIMIQWTVSLKENESHDSS
jgi:hypothetical protein